MVFSEPDDYIEILKEQIEDKNRLIHALTQLVHDKDQALLLLNATIKDLEDK